MEVFKDAIGNTLTFYDTEDRKRTPYEVELINGLNKGIYKVVYIFQKRNLTKEAFSVIALLSITYPSLMIYESAVSDAKLLYIKTFMYDENKEFFDGALAALSAEQGKKFNFNPN